MLHKWSLDENFLRKRVSVCSWLKPQKDDVMINSDGGMTNMKGKWSCVLRDEEGFVIAAAVGNNKATSVLFLEMQGIFMGLQLAVDMGIHKVELSSDSSTAVNIVQKKMEPPWQVKIVWKEIQKVSLMWKLWEYTMYSGKQIWLLVDWSNMLYMVSLLELTLCLLILALQMPSSLIGLERNIRESNMSLYVLWAGFFVVLLFYGVVPRTRHKVLCSESCCYNCWSDYTLWAMMSFSMTDALFYMCCCLVVLRASVDAALVGKVCVIVFTMRSCLKMALFLMLSFWLLSFEWVTGFMWHGLVLLWWYSFLEHCQGLTIWCYNLCCWLFVEGKGNLDCISPVLATCTVSLNCFSPHFFSMVVLCYLYFSFEAMMILVTSSWMKLVGLMASLAFYFLGFLLEKFQMCSTWMTITGCSDCCVRVWLDSQRSPSVIYGVVPRTRHKVLCSESYCYNCWSAYTLWAMMSLSITDALFYMCCCYLLLLYVSLVLLMASVDAAFVGKVCAIVRTMRGCLKIALFLMLSFWLLSFEWVAGFMCHCFVLLWWHYFLEHCQGLTIWCYNLCCWLSVEGKGNLDCISSILATCTVSLNCFSPNFFSMVVFCYLFFSFRGDDDPDNFILDEACWSDAFFSILLSWFFA